MSGKQKDRSSRLRSLFENALFLNELERIKSLPDEEGYGYDIEVIKLRKKWTLTWEYHNTLTDYIRTGKVDYELGDKDIRVVDYKSEELHPSQNPKDEFRVMQSLHASAIDQQKGVYLKLPKELTQAELKSFINNHFDLIEKALDCNYPNRIKYQSPEQQSKRKVEIFRMFEEGVPLKAICAQKNCESSYVYQVVKEFNEKIKG